MPNPDQYDSADISFREFIVNTLSLFEALSIHDSTNMDFSRHHNTTLDELMEHRDENEEGEVVYNIENGDGETVAGLQFIYTEEHWTEYGEVEGVLEIKGDVLQNTISGEDFEEVVSKFGSELMTPIPEERAIRVKMPPFPVDELGYNRWIGKYLKTASLISLISTALYESSQIRSVEEFEAVVEDLPQGESEQINSEVMEKAVKMQKR